MNVADSSLVVAAFASWHERHEAARRALDAGAELPEHCALETYSVLTRLPPPHRAHGELVRNFLKARFPRPFLRLGVARYREFLLELTDRGVSGGAVYDALVAATAAAHRATLLSCDRRATATYESYGIRFELI